MELNHIKIGKYAVTKDGRTVFVREIAEKEELIRGEEISNPDAPEVEVPFEEIDHIAAERRSVEKK